MLYNFVTVTGGQLDEKEISAYVDHVRSTHPRRTIKSLDIKVDGDYVDLSYTFEPVDFERIRRIQGILSAQWITGTMPSVRKNATASNICNRLGSPSPLDKARGEGFFSVRTVKRGRAFLPSLKPDVCRCRAAAENPCGRGSPLGIYKGRGKQAAFHPSCPAHGGAGSALSGYGGRRGIESRVKCPAGDSPFQPDGTYGCVTKTREGCLPSVPPCAWRCRRSPGQRPLPSNPPGMPVSHRRAYTAAYGDTAGRAGNLPGSSPYVTCGMLMCGKVTPQYERRLSPLLCNPFR